MIEWNKRASKTEERLGGLSRWKHWKTRDGKYRVSECRWLGHGKVSKRFYACVLEKTATGPIWTILNGNKRKRETAVAVCERHARMNGEKVVA